VGAWLAYVLAANADGAQYAGSRGSPLGPMWACAFGALAIANAAALRRAARAAISPLASPEDEEGGALKATSKEGAPLPLWGYGAAALAVAASAFLFSAFVGAAVAHEPHAAVWSAAACIAAVASVAAVLPPLRAARAASPARRRPRPCGCSRACCASACSCVYIWTTLVLSAVVLVGFGIQAPLAAIPASIPGKSIPAIDFNSLQSAWADTLKHYVDIFGEQPSRKIWLAAGRCPNCGRR